MKDFLDRLTLVIVTWKGGELVRDCLDSIVKVYGRLRSGLPLEFLSFAIRSQPWRYYLALAKRG